MNQDEIIAMAKEAGLADLTTVKEYVGLLERFAALAAAKALECKTRDDVVVDPGDTVWVNGTTDAVAVAVRKVEPLTDYVLFGPVPVSHAYSTKKAALRARGHA